MRTLHLLKAGSHVNYLNPYTMGPMFGQPSGVSIFPRFCTDKHQTCCDILTKNVRTTSGRSPKFSQNLFGPPSGSVTYIQGSWYGSDTVEFPRITRLPVLSTVTLRNISYICSQLCSALPCSLLVHFASIKQANVTEGEIVLQQLSASFS